jgi:hypothetical protein
MHKLLRRAFIAVSLLAACLAGAGIYNRFFDEAGGAFCPVLHEAVQLRNMKICRRTGMDLDVFDLRHLGNESMILIKYTDGFVYRCFWFNDREFDYSIDDLKDAFVESCPGKQRNLIMTRRVRHD